MDGKLKYSIGTLMNPGDDDAQYGNQEEAERAAVHLSYNDDVIAVWDNETGEIVSLVYQQIVYSS